MPDPFRLHWEGTDALPKIRYNQKNISPFCGGEAVLFEGRVISRLRSAGYGFTVKKNIGYANLPVDMVTGKAGFEVDIFGETVSTVVAQDVLYDPEGKVLKR